MQILVVNLHFHDLILDILDDSVLLHRDGFRHLRSLDGLHNSRGLPLIKLRLVGGRLVGSGAREVEGLGVLYEVIPTSRGRGVPGKEERGGGAGGGRIGQGGSGPGGSGGVACWSRDGGGGGTGGGDLARGAGGDGAGGDGLGPGGRLGGAHGDRSAHGLEVGSEGSVLLGEGLRDVLTSRGADLTGGGGIVVAVADGPEGGDEVYAHVVVWPWHVSVPARWGEGSSVSLPHSEQIVHHGVM